MTDAPERLSSCDGRQLGVELPWAGEGVRRGRCLWGQANRGSPASQDRRFSWPGSVGYPPIMSGESSGYVSVNGRAFWAVVVWWSFRKCISAFGAWGVQV